MGKEIMFCEKLFPAALSVDNPLFFNFLNDDDDQVRGLEIVKLATEYLTEAMGRVVDRRTATHFLSRERHTISARRQTGCAGPAVPGI